MNSKKILAATVALIGAASGSLNAQEMLAGWDFSQYAGSGFNVLSNPPAPPFTQTLTSNYSDRDPNGVGLEATAIGTLHYDGSFGSTAVTTNGTADQIVPTSASLTSNTSVGIKQFASPNGLISLNEGAQNNNLNLSILSKDAVSLVFHADLSSLGLQAGDWNLSFAGLDELTSDSIETIGLSFSTDGSNYSVVESFGLTGVDTAFTSSTFGDVSAQAYFKLDFEGAALKIDNVALSGTVVPEPSTYAALAGALALAFTAYRRRERA